LLSLPFIKQSVIKILISSLQESSRELIEKIQPAFNEEEMILELQEAQGNIFYDVSLYDSQKKLIFDTYRELYKGKIQPYFAEHVTSEVIEAFEGKPNYRIKESLTFGKMFVFVATPFSSHGQEYVIRCGFPYEPIQRFGGQFDLWFLGLCLIALIFFSILTLLIFNRFQRPIGQIIRAIRTYQEGKKDKLPEMLKSNVIQQDEDFARLAQTLTSLYEQVQQNIKQVIAERNEKEAVLESLVEGVIAVDGDMNIRYINFVGSKMLGFPKRHLLGKPFPEGVGSANQILFKKSRELLQTCQQHNNILTDSVTIESGKKVYLDLVAAPKFQGTGAIIVLQDKSSQYKVLEMGKDFVANASHELRTPITIIRGFAETLQDVKDIPKEMLDDIVEKIVRNCQRMDTLVKNLLTLADIDNIPISNYQECDLGSLLENCKEIVTAVYQDASITIEKGDESITAYVDPNILELAITNLLDNAAKYSKPPASIRILLEEEGNEIKISISDKGIGIPPQDVEHIFERFYTVNKAHSRKLGGAGLGLSLVKTIIEKHEGTIEVSSILGVGTTFTIRLPHSRSFEL
jgi:two-component system, OmpR family, phosphate regulon sensor histidine kinase PhoR